MSVIKLERKPRGYWQDEDNIKSAVLDLYIEVGKENFGYKTLKENGPLSNAIRRSGKTLKQYADELGLENSIVPKNYYKNIDNLNREILNLADRYGFFPNKELLALENKSQIPIALNKYFNKSLPIHLKELGISYNSSVSKLETYVRKVLNVLIQDEHYVDGKRKKLLDYGVNTLNPDTGGYLQIDRYYYQQRLAIEIQGQQHYKPTTFWNETRVRPVQKLDAIKKAIIEDQGIKLLYVRYNQIGIRTIYNQLENAGVDKLCEFSGTLYETILSQA